MYGIYIHVYVVDSYLCTVEKFCRQNIIWETIPVISQADSA